MSVKKIAILGCENSHADNFLALIRDGKFTDVSVEGVYSEEIDAAGKLAAKFGVPVLSSPDELVGKLDGVMITARHGAKHFEFAKPYLADGIPMFIDKPITCDEAEAVAFMREAKRHGVRLCGGSSCVYLDEVQRLKAAVESGECGTLLGGTVVAPLFVNPQYGGFWFYAQHLVEILLTIFGGDVRRVFASKHSGSESVSFIAKYDTFDVTATYTAGTIHYYAAAFGTKALLSEPMTFTEEIFRHETDNMRSLLDGNPMKTTYEAFIRPVFVQSALLRSLESGAWEEIHSYTLEETTGKEGKTR